MDGTLALIYGGPRGNEQMQLERPVPIGKGPWVPLWVPSGQDDALANLSTGASEAETS